MLSKYSPRAVWQSMRATWQAADYTALLCLLIPFLLIIGRAVADAAVVLVCVLFLCDCIQRKNWSWLRNRWVQVGLVTWAYLFISAAFALADREAGFMRALTWGRWIILTAAIVFWCSQRPWWRLSVGWFLVGLVTLVSLDALTQYAFGVSLSGHHKPAYPGRLSGPFNRLVVGIFIARLFWPALAQLLGWAKTQIGFLRRIAVPLGFIGIATLAVLLSGERMAFLLTGLALGVFFLFAKGFRKPLFLCGLPLVIAVVGVVATQPSIRARVLEGHHMLENFGSSGYGIIFNNALTAWRLAPVTGVGPKNFVLLCEQNGQALGYHDAVPETPEFTCARHPHNPYLEWLAETGLIGVALFSLLGLVWARAAIRTTWQARRLDSAAYLPQLCFAIGLIPFLWPLQGNMSVFSNWNGVLFWWTIGVLLAGLQERKAS